MSRRMFPEICVCEKAPPTPQLWSTIPWARVPNWIKRKTGETELRTSPLQSASCLSMQCDPPLHTTPACPSQSCSSRPATSHHSCLPHSQSCLSQPATSHHSCPTCSCLYIVLPHSQSCSCDQPLHTTAACPSQSCFFLSDMLDCAFTPWPRTNPSFLKTLLSAVVTTRKLTDTP